MVRLTEPRVNIFDWTGLHSRAVWAKAASEVSKAAGTCEQFQCGHSIGSWKCKGSDEEFGYLPKDNENDRQTDQRQ